MRTSSIKRGAIVCSALLASVAMTAETAQADPTVIGITGIWGDGAAGVYTFIQGTHQFGGPATVLPGGFLPTFTVEVTSGLSTRPGWEYELVLDFYSFGLFNNPPNIWWDMQLDIKQPGGPNPITDVQVKNGLGQVIGGTAQGNAATDGGTIFTHNLIADFNLPFPNPDVLIIQWNQGPVPAPGVLALLGVAGMVGSRRRRA